MADVIRLRRPVYAGDLICAGQRSLAPDLCGRVHVESIPLDLGDDAAFDLHLDVVYVTVLIVRQHLGVVCSVLEARNRIRFFSRYVFRIVFTDERDGHLHAGELVGYRSKGIGVHLIGIVTVAHSGNAGYLRILVFKSDE